MDFTEYRETTEPSKYKTIFSCYVRLDKKAMINTLQSDYVFINGEYFKVPEQTLLECLINERFGEIKLDLERID
jgi:hypothetical protein